MSVATTLAVLLFCVVVSGVESTLRHTKSPLENWKLIASPIYGAGYKQTYSDMIRHLTELVEIEREVDRWRGNILLNPNKGKSHQGLKMIQYYMNRWVMVARLTSLNRKRRTLSENLLELMRTDSNECSVDEMNNLKQIFGYFEAKTGLRESLATAYLNKRLTCQDRVFIALSNPFKLIGSDDVARVLELQVVGEFDRLKRVRPRRFGINIAEFLVELGHPSIMLLNLNDMAAAYYAIENAYLGEVYEPSWKICGLGRAIQNKSHLNSYFIREPSDYRRVALHNMYKAIYVACSIVKLNVSLVVTDIRDRLETMYPNIIE